MKAFTRKELTELRDRAQSLANTPGLNHSWAAAYTTLAVASDYLDAMIARSGIPLEIGTVSGVAEKYWEPDKEMD